MQEIGDDFPAVLEAHNRIFRTAIEESGGVPYEPKATPSLRTGIGMLGSDDYVAIDIRRAAQIAAGHAGQTLLSRPGVGQGG